MFRHTLLALATTCGLFAGTEVANNTASAQTRIRVGLYGHGGGVSVGFGGYYPGWSRPAYPLYYPAPPIVYTPPPVLAPPVLATYDVYYRYYPGEAWRPYATFASHFQAHNAMDELRLRGLEAIEVRR